MRSRVNSLGTAIITVDSCMVSGLVLFSQALLGPSALVWMCFQALVRWAAGSSGAACADGLLTVPPIFTP